MMKEIEARLYHRLFSIPNKWPDVLYIHTPFCRRKCFYCVYGSKEPESDDELDIFYRRLLPSQIQQIRGALEQMKFSQVYFGGGTPTIAGASTLESIYKQIPGFQRIPFKACEASPDTITDEHIDLFGRYGFNYISFGVQTLSGRVLEAQNRPLAGPRQLKVICEALHRRGVVTNLDLILFLDTGAEADIDYSRRDLEILMSEVRPASITLHYNYHIQKSPRLRRAMMDLALDMSGRYPEYSCVNSLLEETDVMVDMWQSAAYRLMRSQKELDYYMLPKIPWMHAFGHNMLAVGAYRKFRVRYNYYYIFDFIDKYTYREVLKRYEEVARDFKRIRGRLGLPASGCGDKEDFFVNQEGKDIFKQIMDEANLPYYDFCGSA